MSGTSGGTRLVRVVQVVAPGMLVAALGVGAGDLRNRPTPAVSIVASLLFFG